MGLLDRMAALDDRFWAPRQRWVRAATVVFFAICVVARLLIVAGVAVSLTAFGLALVAGIGAVALAAGVSSWPRKRGPASQRDR